MEIDPILSFVIPTLNEDENIRNVIESIEKYTVTIKHEIVVVDNGSEDRTSDIVNLLSVPILVYKHVNISELRNIGARHTTGTVLVFIDGDVEITHEWGNEIRNTLDLLDKNRSIITGSRCGIANENNFIERFWFKPLLNQDNRYINSGHLIVHRELFEKLNGFNPSLITGEDTDFSFRALKYYDAQIVNNPKLRVIHHGYPNNICDFVKREFWHGTSSGFLSKLSVFTRVKIASLIFICLHIITLISIFQKDLFFTSCSILTIFFLCLYSAFFKYGSVLPRLFVNAFLYYFYYLGRSLSLIKVMINSSFMQISAHPSDFLLRSAKNLRQTSSYTPSSTHDRKRR